MSQKRFIIFSIIFLILTLVGYLLFRSYFSPASPATLTPATAHWAFDEGYGQTVNDRAGNSNAGTLGANSTPAGDDPTWATEDMCVSDKCLKFTSSSSQYVNVAGSITSINTVSFWVRPISVTSISLLVLNGASGNASLTTDSSGVIQAGAGFTSPTIYIDGSVNSTLIANNWQHVTITTASDITASNVMLGRVNTGYFNGFLDEVKLYDYALTVTQVAPDFASRGSSAGVVTAVNSELKWLSDGLVGYWKMDESSWTSDCSTLSVTDSSGNGLHGKSCPNGSGVTTPTVGKFANAGTFDGTDDYVTVTNNSTLNPSTFTVSFWLKKVTEAADWDFILGKRNAAGQDDGWAAVFDDALSDRKVYFSLYGTGGTQFSTYGQGNSLAAGTWRHYTFTFDGSEIIGYEDGIQVSKTPVTSTYQISSNGLYFATYVGTSAFPNITIDETRYYNRSLSASEIYQLYNWVPGPVAHWKLDENTGTSAYDTSGNSKTLTLTNSPIWATGKFGSAITFAGSNQHLLRADDSDFDFADGASFSVSVWFKHTTASAQEIILSKYNEAGYKIIMESDGDITCALDYDGTWTPTDSATSTAATYDDNNWHQITCVKNGASSLSLYIDGSLIASDTSLTANNTLTNSDPLYIGINADGTSNDFTGSLDDIQIYNYARTQHQILHNINATYPSTDSPLERPLVYWKFDEAIISVGYDSSGNNRHITISKTPGIQPRTSAGKFGSALNLAGTAGGTGLITGNEFLFGLNSHSFSTWVKSTSATNPVGDEYILSRGAYAGSPGYTLYFEASTGKIIFEIDDDTTWDPDDYISSADDFYDGQWHHIVAVKTDTTKIELYVDSKLVAQKIGLTANGSIGGATSFNIGRDGTISLILNGNIDETYIFDTALDQYHVNLLFNHGKSASFGSISTSSALTPDYSLNRSFCVPGDSTACNIPIWGYYPLDENTGTTSLDYSHLEQTLTLNGSAAWVPGKYGSAIKFNGTSAYLTSAGTGAPFNAAGNFTITAWVKIDTLSNFATIVSKMQNANNKMFLQTGTAAAEGNDDVRIYLRTTASGDAYASTTGNILIPGVWQHWAFSFDGSQATNAEKVKFYLNNIQQPLTFTGTHPAATSASSVAITLGASSTPANFLNGVIDDVRIFNYNLTPAQLTWNFNRGEPVAWYKFDESSWTNDCSTDTVFDSSVYALHADSCPNSTGQTTPEAGKWNNAMHFDDSNDYVTTADNAALNLTSRLSISAWVYTDANEADNVIVSKGDSYEVGINNLGDVYFYNGTSTVEDGSAKVLTGAWHHVVVTNDDTTTTYYVDGVLTGTDALGIGADNATALRIGYDGTNYFDGLIDDVRIYNYTLNSTQVKTLFNSNSAVRF